MKFSTVCTLFLSAVFFMACGGNSADTAANGGTGDMPATSLEAYTDPRQALADGIKLLDAGETDRAIEVLNQAVKLDPDLADAYFQLGVAYSLIESRELGAIRSGEIAANENVSSNEKPRSVTAFEKAIESYKKQTAANKEDHLSFFNLGRSYNKLNDDEDAEKAFERAAELNPEDAEYQTEFGSILIKLAKYRQAIAPLKKALELDPENVEAQELLEEAEAGRRRVEYKSTPKEDPKNANSNSGNSNTQVSTPSNSSKPPEQPKPAPTKQPSNKP